MSFQAFAGIISGILVVSNLIPYLRSIFYGTTRPSIISQSLWGVTALIVVAGQYAVDGPSWSMAVALMTAFNNVVIVIICLRGYGYRGHTRSDFASAFLAVFGLVLWQATSQPLYAVIFALLASTCAGFPTYHKTFKHPETENALAWGLVLAAGFFSLIAVNSVSLVSVAFPVFTIIEAGLVVALTFRKGSSMNV